MSEAIWHYERDGGKAGPVSLEELRRLYAEGALADATLVWSEGMADWQPFAVAIPTASGQSVVAGHRSGPPPVPAASAGPPPSVWVPEVPFLDEPVREVALRADFDPRLRRTFGRAWRRFTQTFWPFVGCYALTVVLISAASSFIFPILFMMFPMYAGLSWYYLKQVRRLPVSVEAIFFGFKRRFADLAILNLIVVFPILALYLVAVGVFVWVFIAAGAAAVGSSAWDGYWLVAGIVAGVACIGLLAMLAYSVVGAVMNFAMLAVLDGDLPWRTALSRSWQAVKPHLWKLSLIYFVAIWLASFGTLALYVGTFIFGAWGHLALVMVYEEAFGDRSREEA